MSLQKVSTSIFENYLDNAQILNDQKKAIAIPLNCWQVIVLMINVCCEIQ